MLWSVFLLEEIGERDPLLREFEEGDKAALVGLFLLRRYEVGLRGKAAASVTASLRLHFCKNLQSTTFLNSAVIEAARTACRMTPAEMRERRDASATHTVKLPYCLSLIMDMRACVWAGKGWSQAELKEKVVYLACMWGYDLGARVSEYTKPEGKAQDHSVRVHDLSFTMDRGSGWERVTGGHGVFKEIRVQPALAQLITECSVMAVSSKGKEVIKPKVIGSRSREERQFLMDLVEFLAHSGTNGDDELFSARAGEEKFFVLSARKVRDLIKQTCVRHGLPPAKFSSHSLRKGAISDMRALGSTVEDRQDRGNYVAGSKAMASVYDYAIGLGPLACSSLRGGYQPDTSHLKKLLPAERGTAIAKA